jgi:hypothetical protein
MDKDKLPLKTHIAVWWIIIVGIIGTIAGMIIVACLSDPNFPDAFGNFLLRAMGIVVLFFIGLFYTLSGILLRLKKKWTWIVAIVILSVQFIVLGPFFYGTLSNADFIPYVCAYLIPLILLILDAKNYWAMLEKVKVSTDEPAEQ